MEVICQTTHFLACAMCLSGADSEAAAATTWGIGLMLAILLCVLGAFLGFIFYLARKSRLTCQSTGYIDPAYPVQ